MKLTKLAILSAGALALSSPMLVTPSSAHPTGERCRYQRVEEDGMMRSRSDFCHHMPNRFRSHARPGLTLFFGVGDGWYYGSQPRQRYGYGAGRDQVCLVAFFRRNQVEAGADATVERARLMPRRQAERIDGPNDRSRIFDYGSNRQTRETCRYLNSINS